MRKFLLLSLFCTLTLCSNAQMVRSEEIADYAINKYGLDPKKPKWEEKALELVKNETVALDKNNSIQLVDVIDCGNATKEQLYVLLNYWFTQTFNDANSVIKLNDKEGGVIIGQGYLGDVAAHQGGVNGYEVSVKPIIKADIKNGKVRVTYTLQAYEVTKHQGTGVAMALMGGKPGKSVTTNWPIEKTYPFVEKPEVAYKAPKATSKAVLMSSAYSEVLLDKIKKAVQEGISGNENDEW